MKRTFAAVLVVFMIFAGCNTNDEMLQPGLNFREKLLKSKGCSFLAEISADFGEEVCSFTLDCVVNEKGQFVFSVQSPESIQGITGEIDHGSGKLTFDETILAFPHLAAGEISPVCAPWIVHKALTGGYYRAGGREADFDRMTIADSFEGETLDVEIWLKEDVPVYAEIIWQGRNILSLKISQFVIL